MEIDEALAEEAKAFDRQIRERVENGHVPDLRLCARTEHFYNNPWRDPEYVRLSFLDQFHVFDASIFGVLGKRRGVRVLEAGCGPGHMSLELARAGYDVTGIDLSGACIETARAQAERDPFREGRGAIEYHAVNLFDFAPREKFDAVVFHGALHHFKDIGEVVRKTKSLLTPDGLFLCREPTRDRTDVKNAAFILFLRTMLSIGGGFYKDYPIPVDFADFEKEVPRLLAELRCEKEDGGKSQSANDNESGFAEMLPVLRREFRELKFVELYCFYPEHIGGLRYEPEDTNYRLARFLKAFDSYACSIGLLQSAAFFFHGQAGG